MSEHKWGFFPFDAMDYKAAQAYLDKKSDAGWVLDKLYLARFARFVPAESRYHYVDLDLHDALDDSPDPDYLQLCEDAGWELVKRLKGMLLFRSQPGKRPIPLQTDEAMEADRFWKKYVRHNFLMLLFYFLFLLLCLFLLFVLPSRSVAVSERLCFNALPFQLLGVILTMVYLVWSLCSTIGSYIRYRRLGRFSGHGRPGAFPMGVLSFVMVLLLLGSGYLHTAERFGLGKTVDAAWSSYSEEYTATPELCQSYPVITAADLGLEYSKDDRYLDGRRSLLVDFLDYSEIVPVEAEVVHVLTTERYDCANESLARLLFSARRDETFKGDFPWHDLPWGEVTSDWGFDQVCTARDGSYLLLRKGNIVILAGASGLDLTTPEHLETIRQRGLG